jgi:thioredoxin 2
MPAPLFLSVKVVTAGPRPETQNGPGRLTFALAFCEDRFVGSQPARPVVVQCQFCSTANRVDLARLASGPKCAKCSKPIRLDRPQKVTDKDFERTIAGSSVPVLVDFYADWCGPCKMMAPTLDELAQKRAGQALVLKLDTEANPQTPSRFGIRGIPTVISFQGGKEKARHVGLANMKTLEGLVGT